MNKTLLRVNYVKALKGVQGGILWAAGKVGGHLKSQADKLTEEVRDLKDEYVLKKPPGTAVIIAALLMLSVATALADGTNLVASTNEAFSVKYDLEMGAGGTVGDTGGGAVNASLYAAPLEQLPDLWVGASQSVAWRPGGGETDVGAQWAVRVFTDSLYVNPGAYVGGRYGSGTGALVGGPQVELQWYASDSTYLYGSAGYAFATRGRPGMWWGIGIGWEF